MGEGCGVKEFMDWKCIEERRYDDGYNWHVYACSQLCPTLFNPMDEPVSLLCPWDFPNKNPGMGCHFLPQGIFPTQGSNPPLLWLLYCRPIFYLWATWEAQHLCNILQFTVWFLCFIFYNLNQKRKKTKTCVEGLQGMFIFLFYLQFLELLLLWSISGILELLKNDLTNTLGIFLHKGKNWIKNIIIWN